MSQNFMKAIWEYEILKCQFEDDLSLVGINEDENFDRFGWDTYDNSLELIGVSNDLRLTEEQQNVIFSYGFAKVYLNHKDQWKTLYSWPEEFKVSRGWRRRYVSDPSVTTTNVISGPPNPGYYEISYWPEGWKHTEWLDTGYMRIVPDPLEQDEK